MGHTFPHALRATTRAEATAYAAEGNQMFRMTAVTAQPVCLWHFNAKPRQSRCCQWQNGAS